MKKILFFIPTLSHGGAEKVLVNLVNNLDPNKFDITVQVLFDGGVNRQFLKKHIQYKAVFKKEFRGNSQILKLLSPSFLYKRMITDDYDIIVAYLEGVVSRIVAGCTNPKTKLVSWIHREQHNKRIASYAFRNSQEAECLYNKFNRIIAVSETVKEDFNSIYSINVPVDVLYNTNETAQILELADEAIDEDIFCKQEINIIGVGKLIPVKGFHRVAKIHCRLRKQGIPVHTYILGVGPEEDRIKNYIKENECEDSFTFLGYKTNPYKYVKQSDLFVCASRLEGFSTAATEALIVGTPVCTVEVSGMKEMLGYNNEYGIVTENSTNALYKGIKKLITDKTLLEKYQIQAKMRGDSFSTVKTVQAVERMLIDL